VTSDASRQASTTIAGARSGGAIWVAGKVTSFTTAKVSRTKELKITIPSSERRQKRTTATEEKTTTVVISMATMNPAKVWRERPSCWRPRAYESASRGVGQGGARHTLLYAAKWRGTTSTTSVHAVSARTHQSTRATTRRRPDRRVGRKRRVGERAAAQERERAGIPS